MASASILSCATCTEPAKLAAPVVLFSHSVPMLVPIAPLTVTKPVPGTVVLPVGRALLLKVTWAVPLTGPVMLSTRMLPSPARPKVKVTPSLKFTAPKVNASLPDPRICDKAKLLVRDVPFKSTSPKALMLPPNTLLPVPVKIKPAKVVGDIPSPSTPTPLRVMVPLPLFSVNL